MAVHARHMAGFALWRQRGRCNASPSFSQAIPPNPAHGFRALNTR